MIEYIYYGKKKYYSTDNTNIEKIFSLPALKKNDFLCIFVQDPDPNIAARLSLKFGLDQKYVDRFKTEKRSMRYSLDPLIFVLTDYYTDDTGNIKVSRLLFMIKHNLMITIVADSSKYYSDLFKYVVSKIKADKRKTVGYMFYEFLNRDTKENYDVLERMDDKIAHLEQRIVQFTEDDRKMLEDIMTTKKHLIKMNKRLWATSKIIFTMKKDLTSIKLSKEELSLLDDIYDTLLHQIDLIETQKENVTDFLEIFTTNVSNRLATISNQLNIVMKKMAALTIIIMIPTFIAGVYGMNYHNIPELGWKFGYAFALALMAGATFATYNIFHRKGWI
jgi:magnesium transporter